MLTASSLTCKPTTETWTTMSVLNELRHRRLGADPPEHRHGAPAPRLLEAAAASLLDPTRALTPISGSASSHWVATLRNAVDLQSQQYCR